MLRLNENFSMVFLRVLVCTLNSSSYHKSYFAFYTRKSTLESTFKC